MNDPFLIVSQITEKMDSWLRYSKKTLKKSDDNTENVFGKINATNDCISTLKVRSLSDLNLSE